MMKNRFFKILMAIPIGCSLALVIIVLINSFGCNYSVTLYNRGIDYHGICRWGYLSFIEEDRQTKELWKVNGWQLSFKNQLVMIITKRQQQRPGTEQDSSLNTYNQLQSDYSIVNYAWLPLTNDHVAFFQRTPNHNVFIANFDGWFDLQHRFFPSPPLLLDKGY